MTRRALVRCLPALATASLALSTPAFAAYPDKPITLIVPFAPGGSSDIVARNLAPGLAAKLGQSVVVENVAGAGGVLGTQRTVRAAPDGYTVLVGSGSEILINKLVNPAVTYDGTKDLAPVVFVGTGPMVLLGKPGLAARTMPELLKLAKAKPGSLSYGSAGNGTPMHVAGELLNMRAGVNMTHVPYRGAAPALTDLLGGQIDLAISTLSAAQPLIKAGKVQPLAITGAEPSELAPGIPAMGKEQGLQGFDLNVWFGLFVPAGTPTAVVGALQKAGQELLADPAIRTRLAEQGLSASGASGEALSKFMATEQEKYRAVVKAANITAQ